MKRSRRWGNKGKCEDVEKWMNMDMRIKICEERILIGKEKKDFLLEM